MTVTHFHAPIAQDPPPIKPRGRRKLSRAERVHRSLNACVAGKVGTWMRIGLFSNTNTASATASGWLRPLIREQGLPIEVAARSLPNGKGGIWIRKLGAKDAAKLIHPAGKAA